MGFPLLIKAQAFEKLKPHRRRKGEGENNGLSDLSVGGLCLELFCVHAFLAKQSRGRKQESEIKEK